MVNAYIYQTSSDVVRLVQVTDPHLFKDENADLLGIHTLASFNQVLSEIQQGQFEFDFVLATGDLVQDSSDEGYQLFTQCVNKLNRPVFWVPGNHDYQPKMQKWLNGKYGNVQPHKQLLLGKHWQVLMLDSQVPLVPHGQLSQEQLDWLEQELKANPDRYTLIVLHHHLLSTRSAWLDQHNLRNVQAFAQVLAPFERVKGILHGHIHQQVDAQWQGYQLMCTPSTSVQFKPDHNQFTLDHLQPGWRELELYADGRIVTQVKRIQNAQFFPNIQEEGY